MSQAPTLPDADDRLKDQSRRFLDEELTVDSLTAAEELLDWLESHHFPDRRMVALGDSSFLVTWRSS